MKRYLVYGGSIDGVWVPPIEVMRQWDVPREECVIFFDDYDSGLSIGEAIARLTPLWPRWPLEGKSSSHNSSR